MIDCETVRSELLEYEWNEADRRRVAEALAHAGQCDECRQSLQGYDRLRSVIRLGQSDVTPADGWAAFEERLSATVGTGHARRSDRMIRFLLAASVLLAVVGWGLHWQGRGHDRPMPVTENTLAIPALGLQEIAERVRAFREVSEVFDGQAEWVLISDQASDVGLDAEKIELSPRLLLVRLIVSRGGQVVTRGDLLIVPGRSADLTIPSGDGPQVRYQLTTSASNPHRLQLSVEMQRRRADGQTMAMLASNLGVVPAQVTSVGRMMTAEGQYDVSVAVYPTDSSGKTL